MFLRFFQPKPDVVVDLFISVDSVISVVHIVVKIVVKIYVNIVFKIDVRIVVKPQRRSFLPS